MAETASTRLSERDRPWMMRTYAGHSDAKRSNELYRRNLAKGQTGLSIAFDLPTQTGYDPDHELARGEVGKVGVSIAHEGDMRTLLDGIPLDQMNTSMTINATAAWLLALYIVAAEEQGVAQEKLQGTTQNDILKEYLSRGTYAFPPGPSMRLIADTIAYTVEHVPKWNPINICSYHLQEAGATPVQEIAYAMSNAIAVLDAVRARVPQDLMGSVFGRISFFVNAGVRFIEEHAKLRAMADLWDELGRTRYGVEDEKHRRFRYGVQVNSLGLTEAQPENNVYRIALEALAVTLGRGARARAIQLPAWNEALGLPRPWDQQWSLRLQQVLAYETDLLEYPDIFEGSKVMEALVAELIEGAREEMQRVAELGGAVEAVDYMKASLVESHRERWRRIESGELTVVGMNRFTSTEPSPLTAGADGGILVVDPQVEAEQRAALERWRADRDQNAVEAALAELARVARDDSENIMPATIAAARAGATTGEWAQTLREAFGEYRAPTGVGEAAAVSSEDVAELREEVERISDALGRRLKFLVGKPGLDGHSNGAEQIAVRARDAGMDVVYEGIRMTPSQIANSAAQEGVHVIGLSILSGSHRELIPSVLDALREAGAGDVPVVVGGIIPEADVGVLKGAGVAAVYTPKDWDLNQMMRDIIALVGERHGVDTTPRLERRRPRRRLRRSELGARLRERDLSAAAGGAEPGREPLPGRSRAGRQAAGRGLTDGARRRGARAHRRRHGSPGRRQVVAALAAGARMARPRSVGRGPGGRSELAALGRRAARRPRPDRGRPGRRRRVHPLDRCRRPAGRAGARDPSRRGRAGRGVRRRRDRDSRRRAVRDRGGRRGGHGCGGRSAGSGDVLQFLKAGIMEVPDVLVVTKADLGQAGDAGGVATCARRSGRWARPAPRSWRCRRSRRRPESSELVDALDAHARALDLSARRLRARRMHALADFVDRVRRSRPARAGRAPRRRRGGSPDRIRASTSRGCCALSATRACCRPIGRSD